MPSSIVSSQPRDQTCKCLLMSPALAGGFFTTGATWEAHIVLYITLNIILLIPCVVSCTVFITKL